MGRVCVAQCGTRSGYDRHRRNGEDACGPCKAACADYAARLRGGYKHGPRTRAALWGVPNTFARCARQCGRLVWDFDSGLCGACGEAA